MTIASTTRRRSTLAVALGLAVAAVACAPDSGGDGAGARSSTTTTEAGGHRGGSGGVFAARGALVAHDSCDELLEWIQDEAADRVGPYGLDLWGGYGPVLALGDEVFLEGDVAAAPDVSSPGASEAGDAARSGEGGSSTTNVQEAGVDEPDVVKNDGRHIVSVVDGWLRVVDTAAAPPTEIGAVELDGWDHQLLVDGDRALVLAQGDGIARPGDGPAAEAVAFNSATTLTEVDLTDRTAPRIVTTRAVDGRLVSARMVDGTARVVVASTPVGPTLDYASSSRDEVRVAAANREAVRDTELSDWVPTLVTVDADGTTSEPRGADCAAIGHPTEFAGFGSVTVLTADLGQPLDDLAPVTVVADAEHTYASTDTLTVASTAWPAAPAWDDGAWEGDELDELPVAPQPDTQLHQFDIGGTGPATYLASGEVPGTLLSQFAMSEHEGVLRVASTVGDSWASGPGESEAVVTTLERRGDRLVELGSVDGMGRGEEIFAVRFLGDVGYVVTFEQTDPFYTVDLSDPSEPEVLGELKIPGYSAYLHPIGDDLVIGVGQDATDEGRRLGGQVSLFDVSDLSDPERLATYDLGDGSSAVEWDHHAFLWWDPSDLAVIPSESYGDGGQEAPFSGAVGLRIDREGIAEVGRVGVEPTTYGTTDVVAPCPPEADCIAPVPVPVPRTSPVMRTMVVDGSLWLLTATGLQQADLDTFAPGAAIEF